MKYCPNCRSSYADDSLKFCLQDGTPLVSDANAITEMPTVTFDKTEQFAGSEVTEQFKTNQPTERFITNKDINQMRIDLPETQQNNWEQSRETQFGSYRQPPEKSNTLVAVLATALVMLILFGATGIGAWFYFSEDKNDIVKDTNTQSNNDNQQISKDNLSNISPTPTAAKKDSTPKITPYKEQAPTSDFNPEEIKKEISSVIYSWKSASESLNLDSHMSNYADTVNYYNKQSVNKSFVKSDKKKAYDKYQNIKINLSNMSIAPDSTGENATAVFDKEWNFKNDENTSEGKVKSQLKLSKINGQWKITGEKDLKVYFVK